MKNVPQESKLAFHNDSFRLGELRLYLMASAGKMFKDGSVNVSLKLKTCTLDDLREGIERATSRSVSSHGAGCHSRLTLNLASLQALLCLGSSKNICVFLIRPLIWIASRINANIRFSCWDGYIKWKFINKSEYCLKNGTTTMWVSVVKYVVIYFFQIISIHQNHVLKILKVMTFSFVLFCLSFKTLLQNFCHF